MTTLVVAPVLLTMANLVDLLTIYFLFGNLLLHAHRRAFTLVAVKLARGVRCNQ